MKAIIRPKANSLGFKIGFVLAILHFGIIAGSIIDMLLNPGEPWHMFWILLDYVDFPVSLLLTRAIIPAFRVLFSIPYPYLAGGLIMFITFSAFHLVIGTMWYFYLPILLEKVSKKLAANVTSIVIVVLLMIIPVFSHWLQLLRFFSGNTACFTPWINSCLPALWAGLFIWLYFANWRRKRVLWLLCLAPAVFFYLAYDLYYHIKLSGQLIEPGLFFGK